MLQLENMDQKLLEIAMRMGLLHEDARVEDLTNGVRQAMLDTYHLSDAIKFGYLPQDSSISDLTLDVRGSMMCDGKFFNYSVNDKLRGLSEPFISGPHWKSYKKNHKII